MHYFTMLAGITLIMVASYIKMETWTKILLTAIAVIVMAGGIIIATAEDIKAGTFECTKCGTRFVPNTFDYIKGAHSITRRKLTCPNCGKRSFCKRRLTH